MIPMIHPWLVLAAIVVLGPASGLLPCRGSDGLLPSSPKTAVEAPAVVAGAEQLPAPTLVSDRPPPFVLPPPPDYTFSDEFWVGSPLLEREEAAPQGAIFNVESSVVWIHLRNELQGASNPNFSVGLPPLTGMPITGDIVSFAGNALHPAVTPRFELGYRFPDGFGELKLSYRFLDSSGSDTLIVGDLGPAAQKGRLDIQFIDLDFGTREFSLGPCWEMRTAVGFRGATAYFDSQVNFLDPVKVKEEPFGTARFTRLSQTEVVSNQYIGAHAVFEVGRKLCLPGLTLFSRVEGAGMYGRVHQTFKEVFVEAPGYTQIRVTNGVGTPLLNTQVGFSYDVPQWNHLHLMMGYQYEMWWQFGRGDNDLSFGTLDDQGLFLRAEFTF